jgi:hypothetical protein
LPPGEPVDPEDAAEEAAMWAADDMIDSGEAVDLDPMQHAFDEVDEERALILKEHPEWINMGPKARRSV